MNSTAVLIQAHNNHKYIYELAKKNYDTYFYIHIDLKNDLSFNYLNNNKLPNIFLIKNRISVYWGGVSQINATLLLLREAHKNKNIYYFHLMSGECFPVKSFKEIETEWDNHKDDNFIESYIRPDNEWRVRTWIPFANTKYLRTIIGRITSRLLRYVSYLVTTSGNNHPVYFGSQWFSINRTLVTSIIDIDDNTLFFRNYKQTVCSDEHAFQTCVRLYNLSNIKNKNNRYINFKPKSSSPNYLTRDEIKKIIKTNNYWFIRKVNELDMLYFLHGNI
ncbi:hypothetical protein OSC03_10815 [Morganella morganii]|uniref:beta-1,6-N-acetylglucosaminyltransferase n=1 Tax=Morganella morganii TaxID=582 RepID=UPI002876877C|nr:beta-1,6-N-acetylglucosaminyltransferase [Morganella morganii]MDS0907512.1 hypothetical protein [Morganella morganii]